MGAGLQVWSLDSGLQIPYCCTAANRIAQFEFGSRNPPHLPTRPPLTALLPRCLLTHSLPCRRRGCASCARHCPSPWSRRTCRRCWRHWREPSWRRTGRRGCAGCRTRTCTCSCTSTSWQSGWHSGCVCGELAVHVGGREGRRSEGTGGRGMPMRHEVRCTARLRVPGVAGCLPACRFHARTHKMARIRHL